MMLVKERTRDKLRAHERLLGHAMRRWPRRFRKTNFWWAKLYEALGGGGYAPDPVIDGRWPSGLQAPVRGARHPYKLRLNIRDWMERRAYFSGSIYQDDLELLLSAIVRPGDHFIDVGANIGLITLLASRLVGPGGRVYSFEPAPSVFERLKEHIALNRLEDRVVLHNVALGAATGEAVLWTEAEHAGAGTLTQKRSDGVTVAVRRGDDLLAPLGATAPLIIKIDVEGYDLQALRGLDSTLAHAAAVVIEVTPAMLARIGDAPAQIYELLARHGYRGFVYVANIGRFGTQLEMKPSAGSENDEQYDALFVRKGGAVEARLVARGLIAAS